MNVLRFLFKWYPANNHSKRRAWLRLPLSWRMHTDGQCLAFWLLLLAALTVLAGCLS